MGNKIKILPGGPYEVSVEVPLQTAVIEIDREGTSERWGKGKEYKNHPKMTNDPEEPYHLCRCGQSKNKPYCDGTHVAIGFKGTETAEHDGYARRAVVYEGETLNLLDDESLCASMRFCDKGPQVWGAIERSGVPGYKELAIEESCACAAGRLTVVEKDGTVIEPDLPQEISPVEDTAAGRRGPLWVKGGITLEGVDGQVYENRNRMTLCRCGLSGNMPFCDISHMQCPHMEGFDE